MDAIDHQLLDILRRDARTPLSVLARKLGIARSTVQDRLTKLETRGIIGGYTIRIDESFERRRITAHVMIAVKPKATDAVVAALRRMPLISGLHAIAGTFDLIAIVKAPATGEIDMVLDDMGRVPGIERTQSAIVLSTKFER